MAKARSKFAGVDEHARTIAKAIANGQLPQPTPEIEQFLEQRPVDLLAAADGVCRHIPPAGDDETLGIGYLFLLQICWSARVFGPSAASKMRPNCSRLSRPLS